MYSPAQKGATSAITIQEIAEILGMSLAGVEKSIRTLKQQGRLRRIGPDKGGYWEIIDTQCH
ncbi:MAG: hypothetical protein BroJett041_22090 [Candidatus Jettenia caeni]|nr:MAG: hypothetical protein BroJett041_22090 [Candidatus Jettenia caeni]GJQ46578.1 MAG: hypothetical protein JETCAE04_23320 [Candidatus Jettenia caeni]